MNKLAVFDVDGTLNETKQYAVKAYRETLLEIGKSDISDEQIIGLIGSSPQQIEEALLHGCERSVRDTFSRLIEKNESILMKIYGRPFAGIDSVLRELRRMGILTSVCSNASLEHIQEVLSAIRLTDLIDYIQPLEGDGTKTDSLRRLLRKVRPDRACMTGDRRFDKEAASENRIPFIGCLYGYGKAEILDADFLVSSPEEILHGIIKFLGE